MNEKLQKIQVLVMDVDGVLTDGRIIIDNDGKEIKHFNVKDGYGIHLFKKAGYKTAIISARESAPVSIRAEALGINRVYQDANPKTEAYQKLLAEFSVKDENVCFIGDDLTDIGVLRKVGFAVAVNDAAAEVKKSVHYVTEQKGGFGAVREVIEVILKSQKKWQEVISDYK
ncbi:MAG: HAD-IIIA family hydrolase [Candidatus Omnitrophica bacterium]|nr:HAD-IIIA family hydrolase [Candidatus Omnitrophota bacterium]